MYVEYVLASLIVCMDLLAGYLRVAGCFSLSACQLAVMDQQGQHGTSQPEEPRMVRQFLPMYQRNRSRSLVIC